MRAITYYTRAARDTILSLQKSWVIALVTRFVLIFFVLSIGIIIWKWESLPPQIPLLYSLPWGEDRLVHPRVLFMLPLVSLFWFSINVLISAFDADTYAVFVQILFIASFIVSFISFITVLNIVFLVT